jgi:hypothetical protein
MAKLPAALRSFAIFAVIAPARSEERLPIRELYPCEVVLHELIAELRGLRARAMHQRSSLHTEDGAARMVANDVAVQAWDEAIRLATKNLIAVREMRSFRGCYEAVPIHRSTRGDALAGVLFGRCGARRRTGNSVDPFRRGLAGGREKIMVPASLFPAGLRGPAGPYLPSLKQTRHRFQSNFCLNGDSTMAAWGGLATVPVACIQQSGDRDRRDLCTVCQHCS